MAELMAVVTIMGAAAAAAGPSFGRNNAAASGRAFAEELSSELQRVRIEAVSTRVPRYVFIYSDRVEIRAAKAGSSPTAALVAPTTSDPILRTLRAGVGISTFDVTSTTTTPSFSLSPTTSKQVVFGSMGAAFQGPTAPVNPTPVYLYVNNDTVKDSHPQRRFRVDIAPLSGQVTMKAKW